MRTRILHHSVDMALEDLIRDVHSGAVGVPDFQRNFVWEPSQVVELLDSARNGWPIGSLLLLEGPQPFGLKAIEGGPQPEEDEVRYYVLDGQQRVTAFFHALADTGDVVYYAKMGDFDLDGNVRIRWQKRDQFASRKDHSQAFRLSEFVNPALLRLRSADLGSYDYEALNRFRSEALGAMLESYRVPAIVMSQDIELEALTRIFETLNRTGVKLDAFDLMVAVMRPSDFLLRQEWEEARDSSVRIRSMGVEGIEILKLIALWQRDVDRRESSRPASRQVRGVRQRDVLNIEASFVALNWRRAIRAYETGLEFLSTRGGISNADSVPSWAMLLTLSYLLEQGLSGKEVESWYWRSIALQTYAQGANTQVVSDVDSGGKLPGYSKPFAQKQLENSLLDSASRNKILRLGLRGMALLSDRLDVLTGHRLEGQLAEISVPEALAGRITFVRNDPLISLALSTPQAVALARRTAKRSDVVTLDPVGLESQNFDVGATSFESMNTVRIGAIISQFGSWL